MKFTPESSAVPMRASASDAVSFPMASQNPFPPKVMVPRHSSEKKRPVLPNKRFFMVCSSFPAQSGPSTIVVSTAHPVSLSKKSIAKIPGKGRGRCGEPSAKPLDSERTFTYNGFHDEKGTPAAFRAALQAGAD